MESSKKDPETQYVLKKGGSEVQIVACKGWIESCDYCNKRFNDWVTVDEDVYDKIAEKPGFAIIALKNKCTTEIVSILYDQSSIQKKTVSELERIQKQISNKKIKATKSVILIRWMIVKKIEEKENSILCAHWQNCGVLPKFITKWPGENLLKGSRAVEFSKQTQKWCYPQKDPVWRKPKPPSSRKLEVVEKCNLQLCPICDSYFTPWKSLKEVNESDLAPVDEGLVMLSVVYDKKREVILIPGDTNSTLMPIKRTIKNLYRGERYYLSDTKFKNKNPKLEVCWMKMENIDSDNSCFLFAHWLNADKWPSHNFDYLPIPGENSLNRNKNFVYRTSDEKWFYEIEAFKQTKFSKAKNRRRIFDELFDDQDYGEEET